MEDLSNYLDEEHGVKMGDIKISYILQADDLALISETSAGLQNLLKGLEKFCNRWHILVNLLKTNVLIYGKPYIAVRQFDKFLFNGVFIDETEK